jgi:arginyl-tRNA--protein-N-Asp/Glu arginylyltransferase
MHPAEIGEDLGESRSSPESRLIVIHDQPQACPYLDDVLARMPLRLPIGKLDSQTLDRLLELGYRRTGDFVYRTQCPGCQACEPTRVIVDQFVWSKSLKRVLQRGDKELTCSFGAAASDEERIELFNRHRRLRSLDRGDDAVDEASYRAFMVDSCCDSTELSIRQDGRLIAVAVIDISRNALSAVYTHFDPDYARFSLGTYAILKQVLMAEQTQRRYVYLGMYVAENSHLNYKSRFLVQERLVRGQWVRFN